MSRYSHLSLASCLRLSSLSLSLSPFSGRWMRKKYIIEIARVAKKNSSYGACNYERCFVVSISRGDNKNMCVCECDRGEVKLSFLLSN
jgi:hypothetical protein